MGDITDGGFDQYNDNSQYCERCRAYVLAGWESYSPGGIKCSCGNKKLTTGPKYEISSDPPTAINIKLTGKEKKAIFQKMLMLLKKISKRRIIDYKSHSISIDDGLITISFTGTNRLFLQVPSGNIYYFNDNDPKRVFDAVVEVDRHHNLKADALLRRRIYLQIEEFISDMEPMWTYLGTKRFTSFTVDYVFQNNATDGKKTFTTTYKHRDGTITISGTKAQERNDPIEIKNPEAFKLAGEAIKQALIAHGDKLIARTTKVHANLKAMGILDAQIPTTNS